MTPSPETPQPPFRTLLQAEAFLDSRVNLERIVSGRRGRMSLEPMERLLAALDRPDRAFRSVHVGGTVGKGSTARFLANLLGQRGERAGLYTSPHLQRMSERIVVQGEEIGESDFCEAMSAVAACAHGETDATAETMPRASYFDLLTAAAFVHFRRARVSWAVVEVGLGGRLDSTNAILPELCVITNVGSDHADVLGPRVEDRAREKAGIVKPGIPLVTDARDPRAFAVIERVCRERVAPFHRLGDATPAQPQFLPEFQRRNLALARLAFDALAQRFGWPPSRDEEILAAAADRLPGRYEEKKGTVPFLVLDGAHMPEAVEVLLDALADAPRPRVVLFGAAADKDASGMLKLLARWADRGVMCAANSPRAISASDLAGIGEAVGLPSQAAASARAAFAAASAQAKGGTLLVTGSLYLVGEVRDLLEEKRLWLRWWPTSS